MISWKYRTACREQYQRLYKMRPEWTFMITEHILVT